MPSSLHPPTLKLHKATGVFYVYFAGKRHYLGKDKAAAKAQLPALTVRWAAWAQSLTDARPTNPTTRTIGDVALEWLRLKETDTSDDSMRDTRTYLARFLAAWGYVPCSEVHPPRVHPAAWLNALKSDMKDQGFAPRTINKTVRTAKSLLTYAADMGYTSAYSFRQVKGLPLDARRRIDRTPEQVVAFIVACEKADPRLYPWLRLAYLTAARPIELVRMMLAQGQWELESAHGGGAVWRCLNKSVRKTGDFRYISLTAHCKALLLEGWRLRAMPPKDLRSRGVNSQSALQVAVRSAARSPGGMHFLRHSAATHLAQQGLAPADISLALGHWPPGEWQIYAREDWKRPLEVLARLTLPPRGTPAEAEAIARAEQQLRAPRLSQD